MNAATDESQVTGKRQAKCKHKHYQRWCNMKQRCYNTNHPGYSRWGGRGIVICDEWLNFLAFAMWADATYIEGMTIDRRDNDGNYCPENCRWVTLIDNNRNSETTPACREARRQNIKAANLAVHRAHKIAKLREVVARPVLCTTNGVTYPSGCEAARVLGIHQGNVWGVLAGRAKQAKGFHFVYAQTKVA